MSSSTTPRHATTFRSSSTKRPPVGATAISSISTPAAVRPARRRPSVCRSAPLISRSILTIRPILIRWPGRPFFGIRPAQLTGKQAEFRFDEAFVGWFVRRSEGHGDGDLQCCSRGLASSTPDGRICRGGLFPANTSNAVIGAVATAISPTSQGAITFWYSSNVRWNASGSDAMLIDATAVAARPFFLMKTASGALRFSVTDSGGRCGP
jgi:hypothetical protein